MKIILENVSGYQVYVQKRDLLYLEQTGRKKYGFDQAEALQDDTVSLQNLSSFVRFEGEDAAHYFQDQNDILDYQTYLEMPLSTFENYQNRRFNGENYFDQTMLELLLEKEGIVSIPYPIMETTKKCLKCCQIGKEKYSFYSSFIPKLYYLKKEGENVSLTRRTVPESFLEECEAKACVDTFEDEYMPVSSKRENILLLMPKPKEKQKEEYKQTSRQYIKDFFKRKKKQGK